MRFRLIDAEKARLPIDRMCALLAVSASGYYAWRNAVRAGGNWMTWCCWPMSGRILRHRMGPTGARACMPNYARRACRSGVIVRPG